MDLLRLYYTTNLGTMVDEGVFDAYDMTDFRTISAFRDSVMHMIKLLETNPEIVICDLHPNYNSVMVANEIARDLRIPVAQVQTYSEIQ